MSTRESIKPVASFLFAATLACPAAVLAAPGDGGGGGGGVLSRESLTGVSPARRSVGAAETGAVKPHRQMRSMAHSKFNIAGRPQRGQ